MPVALFRPGHRFSVAVLEINIMLLIDAIIFCTYSYVTRIVSQNLHHLWYPTAHWIVVMMLLIKELLEHIYDPIYKLLIPFLTSIHDFLMVDGVSFHKYSRKYGLSPSNSIFSFPTEATILYSNILKCVMYLVSCNTGVSVLVLQLAQDQFELADAGTSAWVSGAAVDEGALMVAHISDIVAIVRPIGAATDSKPGIDESLASRILSDI